MGIALDPVPGNGEPWTAEQLLRIKLVAHFRWLLQNNPNAEMDDVLAEMRRFWLAGGQSD